MTSRAVLIEGQVVEPRGQKGVTHVRVEAWDATGRLEDLVASALTDSLGRFRIDLPGPYVAELDREGVTALFFKVLAGEQQLAETRGSAETDLATPKSRVRIALDPREAAGLPPETRRPDHRRFAVRGRVVDDRGAGMAGQFVRVFDQGTAGEAPLATATTGRDGSYRLSYTSERLTSPEKPAADLVVRLYSSSRATTPIASSPLILNAFENERVDLFAGEGEYRGPTEYDLVRQALEPHLRGVETSAIDANGLAVLSKSSGVPTMQAAFFVRARLEGERTSVSPEDLYGLYRQNMPTKLLALAGQSRNDVVSAIEAAAAANVVGPRTSRRTSATATKIAEAASRLAAEPEREESRSLRRMLEVAGLSRSEQEALLMSRSTLGDQTEVFWGAMEDELGARKAQRARAALEIGALSLDNEALVESLLATDSVAGARDLAGFTEAGWTELLTSNRTPIPEAVRGGDLAERRRNYAVYLARAVESRYPTAVFAQRWKSAGLDAAVARFFDGNPEFDFSRRRVREFLRNEPGALDGVDDREALTGSLEALERLFRIAPETGRFDHVAPLFADGVTSAFTVRSMGQGAFLQSYATASTQSSYRAMFREAVRVSNVALNVFFRHSGVLDRSPMYVLPRYAAAAENQIGDPDLESLFGSLDFCDCEECQSVLGPSAYLADLLMYLHGSTAKDGETGLEKLFERRPDLGNVKLSCENSHTPMPYIDLVNEVLENAVHPRAYAETTHEGVELPISAEVPQTEAEADELAANPEHLDPAVYDTLAGADSVHPWNLPFSLWREEAALYLRHLGAPRHRLIEIFRPGDALARACEYLGLLHPQDPALGDDVELLTSPTTTATALRAVWGVADLADLEHVPTFLARSGLAHGELVEVLRTRYVNADGALRVDFDPEHPCSLQAAELSGLSNSKLDRLHRFLRLQRKLDWSSLDLDRTLTALGAGEITAAALERLAAVEEIRQLTRRVPLDRLGSWWSPAMGTVRYGEARSLYDRVFLNKAVHSRPEGIELYFGLNAAGDELQDSSRSLTDAGVTPLVLASVNLTESDLLLLVEQELGGASAMNLASLSLLHRVASFCKSQRLRIREFLALKAMTGLRPLADATGPADPADTLAFLEVLEELDDAGLEVDELEYLLRHSYGETSDAPPQSGELARILEDLRDNLARIRSEQLVDESADLRRALEDRLALVFEPDPEGTTPSYTAEEKVQFALAIVDRSSVMPPAGQESFLDENFAAFVPNLDAVKAILLADLPAEPAAAGAELDARSIQVLEPLVAHLLPRYLREHLTQKLAAETGLEPSVVDPLLAAYLAQPSEPSRRALEYFLSDEFLGGAGDISNEAPYQDGFSVLERLHKIAAVLRRLEVRAEELPFLFEAAPTPAVGWLDLARLPLEEPTAAEAQANFTGWRKLNSAYRFQRQRLSKAHSVVDIVAMANDPAVGRDELRTALAARTGWNEGDLEVLLGPGAFDVRFASDSGTDTDETWLLRLDRAFDALRRTGVGAEQILWWTTDGVSYEQARAVKSAAKAKYDAREWLAVAGDLRDELREKQRDALQSFVLARDGFETADDLYAHYLIDTEMTACMVTSRLRLAIASVQLFIQRILMNLEEDQIEFGREEAEEWKWRKTYRVWDANRRVFLYPENWIEPELRDDKTVFFREMEDALLQREVTDRSVEDAFLAYLRSLDGVANLDVRACLQDEEGRTTHVFARTKGKSHRYFHRQWRHDLGRWTPWERLDLDVEGDHLLPFQFNRRVYLCWIKAAEQAEETDPDQSSETQPLRHYELRLAWSEYRDGSWSPSNVSEDPVTTELSTVLPDIGDYHFQAEVRSDEVRVYCMRYQPFSDAVTYKSWHYREFGRFLLEGCQSSFRVAAPTGVGASPWTPEDCDWYYRAPQAASERFTVLVRDDGQWEPLSKVKVLRARRDFKAVLPANEEGEFNGAHPFFYADERRTFFIQPTVANYYRGPLHQLDPGRFQFELLPQDLLFGSELLEMAARHPGYIDPSPEVILDPAAGGSFYRGARAATVVDRRAGDPGKRGVSPVGMLRTMMSALTQGLPDALGSERVAMDSMAATRLPGLRSIGRGALGSVGMQTRSKQTQGATVSWMDPSQQGLVLDILHDPLFRPELLQRIPLTTYGKRYLFKAFYHPYACLFIEQLNKHGLDGVLRPDPRNGARAAALVRQAARDEDFFAPAYEPTAAVDPDHPVEEIDFSYSGAYSQYNWELFFHAPLLIATRLMQNQRFGEAQKWFHYVFDPTEVEGPAPKRFWKFKPFFDFDGESQVDQLMRLLNEGDPELEKQVEAWESDPFDPHTIARMRIVAYMRTVVMKYLDNLIEWGDYLFRQDTMETVGEATQLYVLAAQILGRRPEQVEGAQPEARTFNELFPELDEFSNAFVDVESAVQFSPGGGATGNGSGSSTLDSILYFCIPNNQEILRYWDVVADRLTKIRTCRNIEGVERQLALYEPPIDPSMLVRAAAAGISLESALADLFAPLPYYRFRVMAERALALAQEVQALGASLLAALEKKDGEVLARLRAGHERDLLLALEQVKQHALEESQEMKRALEQGRARALARQTFFEDRARSTAHEQAQLARLDDASMASSSAESTSWDAAIWNLLPNFSIGIAGFGGSPTVSASFGGSNIAGHLSAFAGADGHLASIRSTEAALSGLLGGYERRTEDWDHEAEMSGLEAEQIQRQIDAAVFRVEAAKQDLAAHQLQIQQAKDAYDYLSDKFTNQDLYGWLTTQLATLYFQAYQLAYDVGKRAERACRHELGLYDTDFIQFGYWDSLKKGLLSGERLAKDIRRMQVAYMERNRREYELVKHVTLRALDPAALVRLRETGECEFSLPEALFDLDYPGQYMRRVKSVRLTLPCVAGPYTTVSAKLTLLSSRARVDSVATGSYAYEGITDPRFRHNLVGVQSIATSSGQADSGLFELDFRDERYLPFEGAGAISTWRLELPREFRQYDYDSITDVLLHLSYTARDGGTALRLEAEADLLDSLNKMYDVLADSETGLARMVSLRHEFPGEFHHFLNPGEGLPQQVTFELGPRHFPYGLQDRDPQLLAGEGVTVLIKQAKGDPLDAGGVPLTVRGASAPGAWTREGDVHSSKFPLAGDPFGAWALDAGVEGFDPQSVEDVLLLLRYTIS